MLNWLFIRFLFTWFLWVVFELFAEFWNNQNIFGNSSESGSCLYNWIFTHFLIFQPHYSKIPFVFKMLISKHQKNHQWWLIGSKIEISSNYKVVYVVFCLVKYKRHMMCRMMCLWSYLIYKERRMFKYEIITSDIHELMCINDVRDDL